MGAGWLLLPAERDGLAVTDEQGRVVLSSVGPMTLRYRHSVAGTIVEEDFVAGEGGVSVRATRFSSSGAGLPSQPEWGGSFAAPPGEPFRVEGMTSLFPEVIVRVGYTSEQVVVANGRETRLDTLVAPGSAVILRPMKLPRLPWLPGNAVRDAT